jgi:hypothetical protein
VKVNGHEVMDKIGFLFFAGVIATPVGYIIDGIFDTRFFVVIGVLLMAPLFLSIAAALSSIAAFAIGGAIGSILLAVGLPKPLVKYISYALIAALFVLVLSMFFFGGSDSPGPRFWGSID